MSLALVKFVADGVSLKVPTGDYYIKGFVKSEFVPGMRLPVFWSPDPKQTPTDVLEVMGSIKEIEKLPETNNRGRSSKEALPGYYEAEILRIESPGAPPDEKRIKVPTRKSVESKLGARKKRKTGSNEKPAKYVSKGKAKKMMKRGDCDTLEMLEKKLATKENFETTDESSDDSMVPKKDFDEVKAKLERSRDKNAELRAEIKEIRAINDKLTLQKEVQNTDSKQTNAQTEKCLKDLQKNKTKIDENTESKTPTEERLEAAPKNIPEVYEHLCSSSPNKSFLEQSDSKFTTELPNFQGTPIKAQEENESVAASPSKSKWNVTPAKTKPFIAEEDTSKISLQLAITPRKMKKIMHGVKASRFGDSVFVKNAVVAIFGVPLLIDSSWAGKRNTKIKSSMPRPALPDEGKDYLRELFKERLSQEKPPLSEAEMALRASDKFLRDAVNEKIKDLRKSKNP